MMRRTINYNEYTGITLEEALKIISELSNGPSKVIIEDKGTTGYFLSITDEELNCNLKE